MEAIRKGETVCVFVCSCVPLSAFVDVRRKVHACPCANVIYASVPLCVLMWD